MFETIVNGNRIRIFDDAEEVPSIKEMVLFTEHCDTFINSATLNPKWVNAYLYSLFSKQNYSSFIYAFTVQFGRLRSTSDLYQKFEMNARRVEKLCKRREILLSPTESLVIDRCKNLHELSITYENQLDLAERLKSELADCYLK